MINFEEGDLVIGTAKPLLGCIDKFSSFQQYVVLHMLLVTKITNNISSTDVTVTLSWCPAIGLGSLSWKHTWASNAQGQKGRNNPWRSSTENSPLGFSLVPCGYVELSLVTSYLLFPTIHSLHAFVPHSCVAKLFIPTVTLRTFTQPSIRNAPTILSQPYGPVGQSIRLASLYSVGPM